jgi:hypothetical protein
MNRLLVFAVLAVVLAGCGVGITRDDFGAPLGSPEPRATARPSETQPATTTATIGWQATAAAAETARVAAEGTGVAAARLMVEATAAFEVRVQEQLKMTAEAERQAFESYSWTATARWTSVPATQTQQAIMNTQIAAQQALMAGQLTATHEAPTQVRAMSDAENYAQYAPVRVGFEILGLFSISVFLLFIVGFVIWRWRSGIVMVSKRGDEDVYHELDVTHVQTVNRADGHLKINRYVVPCSPDALTELAEGLMSGNKTLRINLWEGRESQHFTRDSISVVRSWMQSNFFAMSAGGGALILTDCSHVGDGRIGGKEFLSSWLDHQALPDGFEFGSDSAH